MTRPADHTRRELDYLRRIGWHSETTRGMRKATLLENYINASAHREWGEINGGKVLAFAREELRKEIRNEQANDVQP